MTDPEEPFNDTAPKGAGGRPPKLEPTDKTFEFIRGLGMIQATKPEIAAVMNVTLPTLRKFFNEYPQAAEAYESGMGHGKASLRRRQWKMAEKNPTMAIWLGKNWLSQADRSKHEHTGKDGAPIATVNLANLSDKELADYEALCLKLGADADAGDESDVPAGDLGGDPGGEGPEGYGEEPV